MSDSSEGNDKNTSNNSKNTKKYSCEFCDKVFSSKEKLTEHKKKKHEGKVCSYCGKNLGIEIPYECKFCNKTFCSDHRLPETHECPKLGELKEKVKEGEPMFPKKYEKVKQKVNKYKPWTTANYSKQYKTTGNFVKKLKRINWKRWLAVLIILFVFLSIWKPHIVKKYSPKVISPYINTTVDFINNFPENIISPKGNKSVTSKISKKWKENSAPKIDTEELERQIHKLINKERKKHNLSTLEWDEKLSEIARFHSKDMVENDYFSHYDLKGNDFEDRYKKYGYECEIQTGDLTYSTGAENIFQNNRYSSITYINGVPTYEWNTQKEIEESTVNGWMNSKGHRENILKSYWKNEGIGVAIDYESDVIYITENFC